jgi:hypothetical protein
VVQIIWQARLSLFFTWKARFLRLCPNKQARLSLTHPTAILLSHIITRHRIPSLSEHNPHYRYCQHTMTQPKSSHVFGPKQKPKPQPKPKPKPKPSNAGNSNAPPSRETDDPDGANANEGDHEQLPIDDTGDGKLGGESPQAGASKADKGKGKQPVEVDRQAGNLRDPEGMRFDFIGSLIPYIKGRSAEWTYEHYGQVAQPSTRSPAYKIPSVNHISWDDKISVEWPRHGDNSQVSITEFEQLVQGIHKFSSGYITNQRWRALKPDLWLKLLSGICNQAIATAKIETTCMGHDLEHWIEIFPKQAANLQWPMSGHKHMTRPKVRAQLVH